jgi:predicted Zn-dependent protease with MMP-like domain
VVTEERFRELVGEALDSLPEWVLEEMDNIQVFVEDEPPADQPTLLGLYSGVPLSRRGFSYSNVLPDSVTLYRGTIERTAADEGRELREVIFHTLAHELAHHFGISDERLLEIDAY